MARKPALTITHPDAAGIDIGGSNHWVSIPPERDDEPIREFGVVTGDLNTMADWLLACGVKVVAMESTGVYWIPVYELLESRGLTVHLVNARHVKNVSGRKSDVLDCQWLQQLMSYGLLSGAFRPAEMYCPLRAYVRQKATLVADQARQVQRMQKALTQMNLQLTQVLADIVGVSGQRIIRAILDGERDGRVLAKMADRRVRSSENDIAAALQGTWREEHLFALRQAVALYDAYAVQLEACDQAIAQALERLQKTDEEPPPATGRPSRAKHAPRMDLRAQMFRMVGVDLTRIDGIDITTALKVLAEVGGDLSRFKTVKHFCSWLGLCPGTKISGGKVLSSRTKPCANRAAAALRMAAASLRKSESALGAKYRRLCSRMDKPKAITAMAHRLARLIYLMITKGSAYIDQGQALEEERHQQRVLHHLQRQAGKLGMTLVPAKA